MTAPTTSTPPAARLIGMSRGDGLTAIAGLLVFICSFLPQATAVGGLSTSMWHAGGLVEIFAVPLLALVVVAFTLLPVQQTSYADADVLGVRPAAWRTVLSLVVAVASIFAIFFWSHVASANGGHIGYGAYLVLVFSLADAAGAILPTYVPDLRLPVMTPRPPKPAEPEAPVGEATGQTVQSDPVSPAAVPTPDPVRGPDPTQTFEPAGPVDPGPAVPDPAAPEPASPPPPPPAPFEPFWACFPTLRPLVDRTNTSLTIGQVSPEEWYLVTALDEHGASVSTSDGRSGLLLDTSGLIRADQTG